MTSAGTSVEYPHMATAAPHVKLLRQLASAKDDYLSGAFDISWDGAKATLYLVFGRPSHAVFDTDQAQIEGEAAIDALLAELPRTFAVSDWRRAMSPHETLSISIDELAGPFVRLAGSYADDPISEEEPEWWSAADSSPDLAFGLSDFPLLPGGRPLWAETSPENVNLAERLAELPPSILILTGAKLRAAAVVSGGDLIDAVWIDDEDQARGEAAGMALLGATKGTLAGYALDDPRVAEALTMLWRLPLAVSGIEMSWLDPASMLAAFRADGLDRVLVIDAPVRGIALFSRGGLVAVYSETQRSAVASPERLRSLLSQARGRLTVMERKPRPVAATAAQTAPSATDFFGVLAPEAPAEATPDAEAPTSEAPETHPEDENHLAAAEPAEFDAGVDADHPAETDASPSADAPVEADTAAPTYATWQTGTALETVAPTATDAAADAAHDTDAVSETASEATTSESEPETAAPVETGQAEAATEQAPDAASAEEPASEAADTEATAIASHPEFETFATEAAGDGSEPPPPPPPDSEHAALPSEADIAASAEHTPPPPAPDAEAAPEVKSKRHWWSRGGSRKSKATSTPTPESIAAQAAAAHEAAEAATFAGWSVRQPNPEPQPVWQRARDSVEGSGDAPDGADAPPPAAEAAADAPTADAEAGTDAPTLDAEVAADAPAADTDAAAPAPTWSVIEPGTAMYRAPSEPSAPPAEADEAPAATEPETATPQGWSARDVIADSVGWYQPGESAHSDEAHEGTSDQAPAVAAEGGPEETDETAHEGDGDGAPHADAEEPDEHETAAESGHAALDWYHPQSVSAPEPEPAATDEHKPVSADEHEAGGETNAEPVAASGDEPASATDHDSSAHAEPAHDFWAEFASPDPDADAATAADTDAEVDEVSNGERRRAGSSTRRGPRSVHAPAVRTHRGAVELAARGVGARSRPSTARHRRGAGRGNPCARNGVGAERDRIRGLGTGVRGRR